MTALCCHSKFTWKRTSHWTTQFIYLYIFVLFGQGRERETERNYSSTDSLPKGSWVRLKPWVWNSVCMAHLNGRDSNTWNSTCHLPVCALAGNWMRSRGETLTQARGILTGVPNSHRMNEQCFILEHLPKGKVSFVECSLFPSEGGRVMVWKWGYKW